MLKQTTTQQINNYLCSQQLLNRHLLIARNIKKADPTRQDVSAFRLPLIDKTNVNQLNQLIQGTN